MMITTRITIRGAHPCIDVFCVKYFSPVFALHRYAAKGKFVTFIFFVEDFQS
jgi:hypothetical protein